MYLVFTRMPDESYRRQLRLLLFACMESFKPSGLMLQVLLSHAGVCGFCLFCF